MNHPYQTRPHDTPTGTPPCASNPARVLFTPGGES